MFDEANSREQVGYIADAKKAGLDSAKEARMVMTFRYDIPEVLDKGRTPGSLLDPNLLAAIPTADSFQDVENGFHVRFERNLAQARSGLERDIGFHFSEVGKDLAIRNLDAAANFLSGLINWMEKSYRDVCARRPDCMVDNWLYTSHCVRAIFLKIDDARQVGGTSDAAPPQLVWGNLQGCRMATEFRTLKFGPHPAVQNVLTLHMVRKAVMREEYDADQKKISELVKSNLDLQRQISKLSQKVK